MYQAAYAKSNINCQSLQFEISEKTSEYMRAKAKGASQEELYIIKMDLEALKEYYYEGCLDE
jgi:hypothetical protein